MSAPARPRASVRVLLLAALTAIPWGTGALPDLVPGAEAAHALPSAGAVLPTPRRATSAVWDGAHAYVFGGEHGNTRFRDIVRVDPANGAVEVMAAKLPMELSFTSAAYDGHHAYIFAGLGGFNTIVRYDPAADVATLLAARLPKGRCYSSAVWGGDAAYVFGGAACGVYYSNEILRFDPASGSVSVMAAKLPSGRAFTSAAWDGRHAYVFGGNFETARYADIVRFDPATDTVQVMQGRLPGGRQNTAAFWDGRHAVVLGGYQCGSYHCDEIVRYDPVRDVAVRSCHRLPVPLSYASAVWTGSEGLVFGGSHNAWFDHILRYTPAGDNCPPVAVFAPVPPAECEDGRAAVRLDGSASYDPDLDEVALAWTADGVALDTQSGPRPGGSFPLGATTVRLEVTDGALVGAATQAVRVVDSVPPVTTASATGPPGKNGWWRGPVSVQLAATDRCGLVSTHYSIDGGPAQRGTSFEVSGDGAHDVAYWSVDLGGNVEGARHLPVPIDTTPPQAALTEPAPGHVYALERRVTQASRPLPVPFAVVVGDKVVRATAADATSGVGLVTLLVDGSPRSSDADAPYAFLWPAGAEALGVHGLRPLVEDVAGNVALGPVLDVLTAPTTPEGAVATAEACRDLPAGRVCPALPEPPAVPGPP